MKEILTNRERLILTFLILALIGWVVSVEARLHAGLQNQILLTDLVGAQAETMKMQAETVHQIAGVLWDFHAPPATE